MATDFNIAADRIYFVIGASLAAGRSFWLDNTESAKGPKNNNVSVKISKDGLVGTYTFRGDK